MNWDSNLILTSSSEEDFKNALNSVFELYDKEAKLLFQKYNKDNSEFYGKHIRYRIHQIDFKENTKWQNIREIKYSTENKQAVISLINELFNELEELDTLITEIQDAKIEKPQNIEQQIKELTEDIKKVKIEINNLSKIGHELNNELYLSFETKIGKIVEEINKTVKKGLQEISGYKNEIELGKNYREMIQTQFKSASKNVLIYFILFIVSIFLFIAILIIPSIVRDWSDYNAQIGWRISIGLPMLWLTSLIFTHYKFYKVSQIKYQHLLNLLGGGAYYIGELLEDKNAKENANSQIIKMLLDYKDLSNLFYREKTPMDKYLKKAIDILKESKDVFKENTTHNNRS